MEKVKQSTHWQHQAMVPERVVRDLAMKSEPPTWAECHELQMCDGTTDE